jgi:ATP-binding cassette subfamily B protein
VLHQLDNSIIDKVAQGDYEFFDSPKLQDMLRIVQDNKYVVRDISWQTLSIISTIISLFTSVIILFKLFPLAGVLVVVATVPSILLNKRYQDFLWSYDYENIGTYRSMNYYYSVLTRFDAAEELRVMNASAIFKDRFFNSWRTWYREKNKYAVRHNVKMFFANLLQSVSLVGTLALSLSRYASGDVTLGDVQLFTTLAEQVMICNY